MEGIRVRNIREVQTALDGEVQVLYAKSKVVEVKSGKIRCEKDENFFKPWLPALRIIK